MFESILFFSLSFLYPLICALIIYVQHNASALNLLGVQNANRLISINVTFFMSLLGWQSMLALFLASFIGPGQVSPDLSNNALALWALWFHIIRLSISLVPNPRPTYSGGGWYGDGRWVG